MAARTWIGGWPVYRQLTNGDRLGRGAAAKSRATSGLEPRTRTADKVVKSVCPYCAVGCGQNVYVAGSRGGSGGTDPPRERVVQIEGDPDSPISPGTAVSEGIGEPPAHHRQRAAVRGDVPAPVRHRVGSPAAGYSHGHDRRPGDRGAAARR